MLVRQFGVVIHCVRDGLVLNALSPDEDWLRWDIFNHFNAKQIADHTKNVVDGMVKRMEMGLAPYKGPFGYRNQPCETENGIINAFVFDPGPDKYMKEAFEMVALGNKLPTEVKRILDSRYCHLTKKLSRKRFYDLLRNPFYYGDFLYNCELYQGNPKLHPPLIDFDLWNRVQEVLNGRKKYLTVKNHHYAGIIRCGGKILDSNGNETEEICGCAVTAEEHKKKLKGGGINTHPDPQIEVLLFSR